MKPIDFIKWLQGYVDGLKSANEDIVTIEEKLEEVDLTEPSLDFPQFPTTTEHRDSDRVPYHTLCSCNPANGGSGLCGCTMANKLVDPNLY